MSGSKFLLQKQAPLNAYNIPFETGDRPNKMTMEGNKRQLENIGTRIIPKKGRKQESSYESMCKLKGEATLTIPIYFFSFLSFFLFLFSFFSFFFFALFLLFLFSAHCKKRAYGRQKISNHFLSFKSFLSLVQAGPDLAIWYSSKDFTG